MDASATYCNEHVLCVCLFVCLSVHGVVCLLPMAVAQSFSGGVAVCCVLWLKYR